MHEPIDSTRAVFELNARSYEPDPLLDRALELFRSDRKAFDALPTDVKSRASIYVDL